MGLFWPVLVLWSEYQTISELFEALAPEKFDEAPNSIKIKKHSRAQAEDTSYQEDVALVGDSKSDSGYNRYRMLVPELKLLGKLQHVVSKSLWRRILDMVHYPRSSGRAGKIKIYFTLCREYYRLRIANDAFIVAGDCLSCARMHGTQHRYQKLMKLFPARQTLKFFSLGIFGSSQGAAQGFILVLAITGRFTKLTLWLPLKIINAALFAIPIWTIGYTNMVPYCMWLTINEKGSRQFLRRRLLHAGRTRFLDEQTNGQAERLNKTIS